MDNRLRQITECGEARKDVDSERADVDGQRCRNTDPCKAVFRTVIENDGSYNAHSDLRQKEGHVADIEQCGHDLIAFRCDTAADPDERDECVYDIQKEQPKDRTRKIHFIFVRTNGFNPPFKLGDPWRNARGHARADLVRLSGI